MIERHQHGTATWVDMLSPTADEVRVVMDEYGIDPTLATDLDGPVVRSGTMEHSGTIKVTLDFPVVKYADIEHQHEIKFLITKDALITVRYADIVSVHKFAKEFEVIAILNEGTLDASGGHLFVALMRALYDSFAAKLDYIDSKLEHIEEEIFNGREKEMVLEISKVSRRLIVFRQALTTHSEVLSNVTTLLQKEFGEDIREGTRGLEERFYYLTRRVAALGDAVDEVRNTNNSLLTTKQNEIMKVLTIMAFVTFPLTLISSVFGMNTETIPLAGQPNDFWMIIGIMATATLGFFGFFRYKDWI